MSMKDIGQLTEDEFAAWMDEQNRVAQTRTQQFYDMINDFWCATMGGSKVIVEPPAAVLWFDGTEDEAHRAKRWLEITDFGSEVVFTEANGWMLDITGQSEVLTGWVIIRGVETGICYGMHPMLFAQVFPTWVHAVNKQVQEKTKR